MTAICRRGARYAGMALFMVAAPLVSTQDGWAQPQPTTSPITKSHIAQINRLFLTDGITDGFVVSDSRGRILLDGEYLDERQVNRGFSLAQTVVGVRWVSPVTPHKIRVKQWENCLSRLFSGEGCGSAVAGSPGESAVAASRLSPGLGSTHGEIARALDQPPGPIARKYALVVGVGKFRSQVQPLQYANKDAHDFYNYLLDARGGRFKRENVILLRDEYATRDALQRGLDEIKRRAGEDDLVILYFSSHGTPPDKYGGVHLVTFDSEVRPRERIWDTSLTEGVLGDFIQQVRARRLVVIMDACYSNGAYSQVAGFLPPGGKSLDAGIDEGYGRSRREMAARLLGAKDLILEDALPTAATVDTAHATGWGKVLISASDAQERAWESDALRNSIFTRYFIDGLRDNGGSIRAAFAYAKVRVPQQVKREKGADLTQTPQLTPSRTEWNISLAVPDRER